ncbi:MAG: thermopsin [Thaumarchaeota archaeon]|nr:thermopsin [Nitrososphaerota archaeon]
MRTALLVLVLLLAPIATNISVAQAGHQTSSGSMAPSLLKPIAGDATRDPLLPGQSVNIFTYYSQEPAPIGIADYGLSSDGPYSYSTNSSLGVATIRSLSTKVGTDSKSTIQLNVNLQFSVNGNVYVYWIQDIASINTTNDLVQFSDNVWNSSSQTAEIIDQGLSGSGTVENSSGGSYYADTPPVFAGNGIQLSLPATVQLEVTSVMSSNRPAVEFSFNDGDGWQEYDVVTFATSGVVTMPGFLVDGSSYNPSGTFYDSELILGGPDGGSKTTDISSDVLLQLYYSNGNNYQMVTNAYNFGSDTGESISNAVSQWSYKLSDGENFASVQAGPGTLGALYNSSQIGEIIYTSTYSSGTIEVRNSGDSSASSEQYPFVGGKASITIYPGVYDVELLENGVVSNLGNFSVGAGQIVGVPSEAGTVQLVLSYSVTGGGVGYSAPILTYFHDGQQTATLSTTPTPYFLDPGSAWSVSGSLPGSSTTERWITAAQTSGAAKSAQTLSFAYYNQFAISVAYSLVGGGPVPLPQLAFVSLGSLTSATLSASLHSLWADAGSRYSASPLLGGASLTERWQTTEASGLVQGASSVVITYYHQYYITPDFSLAGSSKGYGSPTVYCPEFGSPSEVQVNSSAWVDAGSYCVYPQLLPNSTQSARWATSSQDAPVSGPGLVSLVYYYQYPLALAYSVVGGGSPSPPTIAATSFGVTTTVPLPSTSVTEWLDAGSQYTISNSLQPVGSGERWVATSTTAGQLNQASKLSLTFYRQFMVSALFVVVGGGSPVGPTLAYVIYGTRSSEALTATPNSFWADADSQYSVPTLLNGSSSTERWTSTESPGTVQGSGTLTFTYYHQFLLTVNGPVSSSKWYNSSATATVSFQGSYNRTSGVGERVVSYAVDGGAPIVVQPTSGPVSVTLQMGAAHYLTVGSVKQYQVTIDDSTAEALVSLTRPTIEGDNGWYDLSTPVTLVLNGAWNRSAGVGERLVSYTVNGVTTSVSSTTPAVALSLPSISSPENVSGAIVYQYELTTASGSVVSMSDPPIQGDAGWYDSGTSVTVVYNYSWNATSLGSRVDAVGYSLGRGNSNALRRARNGTFGVEVAMTAPQEITVQSVTQYQFTLSGGSDLSFSLMSQTGDAYYDSGSAVAVTTDYAWNSVDGNTKQDLLSYTLDGQVTNVTLAASGTFTTPPILFTGPQDLAFTSVTQFLVSFHFEDNSGTSAIAPSSFVIQVDGTELLNVTVGQVWLDEGTDYQVYAVMWESSNVTPLDQTAYPVDSPQNQTVVSRVFAADLRATDYLGFPISGARVSVTLANGTLVQRNTSGNGTVDLGLIPLGTFQGSLTYLGVTTPVSGDASTHAQTSVKTSLSYPIFGSAAAAAALVVVSALLLLRQRRAKSHSETITPTSIPAASPATFFDS